MKKGLVVAKWAEPLEWRRILLQLAKENPSPKSWTRFVPYLFAATLISAVLARDWVHSDREGMVSTISSVVVFALIYGVLYLFYFLRARFVSKRVWIHENGIEMGEYLGEREWFDFSETIGFYFDTDTIKGRSFRSLNWLPVGAQYPNSAVVPGEVDEAKIRAFLTAKGLEELELDDE